MGHLRTLAFVFGSIVLVAVGAGLELRPHSVRGDESDSDAKAASKARRLEQMRERVGSTKIRFLTGDTSRSIELQRTPIFRYDDQPRGFRDAALWLWTSEGRPVAVEKTEDWRSPERGPTWITCLASASTERISAAWDQRHQWEAKGPGAELKLLAKTSKPEANEGGRLRQFKGLAGRFSLTMEIRGLDRQELRLLPRPLFRYNKPQEHVDDGVLFAWSGNGTNPDAVLLLELRSRAGAAPEWGYALVPVTADKLELQLDGTTVYTKAETLAPGDDTLTFFFEKNSEPLD